MKGTLANILERHRQNGQEGYRVKKVRIVSLYCTQPTLQLQQNSPINDET